MSRALRRAAERALNRTARGAFPRAVRDTIAHRDQWRCVRCGADITIGPASVQHRRPRGMGGTRDPLVSAPSNGILLCGTGTTGCHGWVETHREAAHEQGWSIPWWTNPLAVPVTYWDGRQYKLDNQGNRTLVEGNQE